VQRGSALCATAQRLVRSKHVMRHKSVLHPRPLKGSATMHAELWGVKSMGLGLQEHDVTH
jgi:hypothetical protein